jgi:hypothetical protein
MDRRDAEGARLKKVVGRYNSNCDAPALTIAPHSLKAVPREQRRVALKSLLGTTCRAPTMRFIGFRFIWGHP